MKEKEQIGEEEDTGKKGGEDKREEERAELTRTTRRTDAPKIVLDKLFMFLVYNLINFII